MSFAARYAYVRLLWRLDDVEIVVGVEVNRQTLDVSQDYERVRGVLVSTIESLLTFRAKDDHIALVLEKAIREHWPGRSYFLEVGRGELQEWVQIFEPKEHSQ